MPLRLPQLLMTALPQPWSEAGLLHPAHPLSARRPAPPLAAWVDELRLNSACKTGYRRAGPSPRSQRMCALRWWRLRLTMACACAWARLSPCEASQLSKGTSCCGWAARREPNDPAPGGTMAKMGALRELRKLATSGTAAEGVTRGQG